MKGYQVVSEEILASIQLTPLEPCIVNQGGFMEHRRFLGLRRIAHDTTLIPSVNENPEIEDSVPVILSGERFCNMHFAGHDPIHNYIQYNDCTEMSVRRYHESIISTAERFRHSVDELINNRRLLTSMADVFRDPAQLTAEQMQSLTGFKVSSGTLERRNEFYDRNKIDIEQKIADASFRVEALRLGLIRMFDELYARRMGWGYMILNPGIRFIVYIQHLNMISECVYPSHNPPRMKRDLKTTTSNKTSCVIEINSIDELNEKIDSSNEVVKILKFSERETFLKNEISHLADVFGIWVDTSMGWFTSPWYLKHYVERIRIFQIFKNDILRNPHYGPVDVKLKIIKDFIKVIKKEMAKSLDWYWDSQRSFDRIENFMFKFYHGHFPIPPKNNGTFFHDELK